MARRDELAFALNAGGVDIEALSRVDLEKMRISGEHPVANWFPKVLGPMSLRPGLEMRDRCHGDLPVKMFRYVREIGTSYLLLFSAGEMRVSLDGSIVQVPVVGSTIGDDLWANASSGTATATFGASLSFVATRTATARLRQSVNINVDDRAKANILRIVVSRGPVYFRCGTIEGGQDLISDQRLDEGTHKLAITPDASTDRVFVELYTSDDVTRSVSQIQFESTLIGNVEGDLVLPTPYDWDAVQKLRNWSEIDLIFFGDGQVWPCRIEHRGDRSWSIVTHYTDNGPFTVVPNRNTTITASALRGNITLTTSDAFWQSGHVGTLVEVPQVGKTITQTFDGADQTTDYVSIVGITGERDFYITIAAGLTGTIVLERSLQAGEPTVWATYKTYTAAQAELKINDNLENVTGHYRFRVSAYTSGSAVVTIRHDSGAATGMARITGYTSTTVAQAEVIASFGNTSPARDWRIGEFSDVRGHPRTPIIHDGRMYMFRGDMAYASVVDDYTNYDDTVEGDSAPITRSVGSGASDGVLWALSMQRLLIGTAAFEASIQASEFGEAITPTAWTVPKASFRGSDDIQAVAHDDGAFFVQRAGNRLYEISVPPSETRYRSADISRLNPSACKPGVVRIAVQQQPMTRLYALLEDGTCAVVTFERDDKVVAFTVLETAGGLIEDVEVEPRHDQDRVYFIVRRNTTERYMERLGIEADQEAVDTCTLLDSCTVFTGSVTTVSGLERFAGQSVQVWADGQRRDDITISAGGSYTFAAPYARVVIGKNVPHTFKSVKLAYAAQLGSAVGQTKIVKQLGLVLSRSCLDGLRVGSDAANTDPMPEIVNGAERTPNQFFEHFDDGPFPVPGAWGPDARFYISADSSEGPCTVQAVVIDIETRDDAPKGGN